MKKYLMTGVAALAFAATFTSCSKTDLYDENKVEQDKTQAINDAYEKAFEAAFGKVGANVDWGFGSRAYTRAGSGEIVKPDMTNFPGYSNERCARSDYRTPEGYGDVVAPVTEKEAEWVMDWFSKNPGLSEQGLDIHNFWVQNVGNNGHTKDGYFHIDESVEAKQFDGIMMDKLQIGAVPTEEGTIHALDFNATNGFNDWNLFYVKGGSALQFGYNASYVSGYQFLFKCVQLTVPASCFPDNKAHTGWYVGLSYYGHKVETESNPRKVVEIGIDRLQYADDWVLKIVPGAGEFNDRIIAEDLSASEAGDFDFNDVVFDVLGNDGSKTEFNLIACGGTLPLRINGDDNLEVHKLFGQDAPNANGKYDMFNTGAGLTHDPVKFTVSGVYNDPASLKNLKIEVQKNGSWQELTATTGKAACKILVDTSFPIVPERKGIASVNENFTKYVAGDFVNDFWWQRR